MKKMTLERDIIQESFIVRADTAAKNFLTAYDLHLYTGFYCLIYWRLSTGSIYKEFLSF